MASRIIVREQECNKDWYKTVSDVDINAYGIMDKGKMLIENCSENRAFISKKNLS